MSNRLDLPITQEPNGPAKMCSIFNSLVVNRSGASLKKTGVPVLLNALDSTRFYVGSYARDARLRPSRPSNNFGTWPPLPPSRAAAMVESFLTALTA